MSGSGRTAIVAGAGISGLAAALKLQESGFAVSLIEAGAAVGGAIKTTERDGFLVESGPESFLTEKPAALNMCVKLGLGDSVIGTNTEHRRSFILRGGKLHPTPEGFYLLGPARYLPFVASGLLTWAGKARALADLVIPRSRLKGDESLASFVRRRFGAELLEYLAQPLVAGIYTADAEKLSLRSTFPAFLEIEERYRSVILGLRRRAAARRGEGTSGARYGLFATLSNGLGALVEAMTNHLSADAIETGRSVTGLKRSGSHWVVETRDGMSREADAVCLAVPAPAAGELLRPLDLELGELLAGIRYAPSVTVNLGFRRAQIRHPLDGFGFVVPAREARRLLACTFSSTKFPGRAPAGQVLLRAFLGGVSHPEVAAMPEQELAAVAQEELGGLLGIDGEPLISVVSRHPGSMPQYEVGHLERVGRIRERAASLPGLALAGNGFEGIGLPDCIRVAEAAALTLAG